MAVSWCVPAGNACRQSVTFLAPSDDICWIMGYSLMMLVTHCYVAAPAEAVATGQMGCNDVSGTNSYVVVIITVATAVSAIAGPPVMSM